MAKVEIRPNGGVRVWVSASETTEWARAWPCSSLRGHRLAAEFDRTGSLVDYQIDGRGCRDIPADEFNALTADFLRDKLPSTHSAYFGCVGQFATRDGNNR